MAAKNLPKSDFPFATRIDPKKDILTKEQMRYIQQVEMVQKEKRKRIKLRKGLTGLAFGAVILGICAVQIFTSQEKTVDQMGMEGSRTKHQESKTAAH